MELEQGNFKNCAVVHDLPPIFHYWSNKYLLPKHAAFGIQNPEHFFYLYCLKQIERMGGERTRIASLGSGNCDMEVRIAEKLLASGHSNFTIACLDINRKMLDRGRKQAIEAGVESQLEFLREDFNKWSPQSDFDVLIANQSLHHVLELEHLFGAIKAHLRPNGVFLTCDTIGRNGHKKWPEAMQAIRPFWEELAPSYRFNRQRRRQENKLVDHDHSKDGFEGVRAQDILPLLIQSFHFELFIPYANIILTFVDRAFGPNFDPENEGDRNFIDRVHFRDEEGILSGELKPTQMMAVLRNEPTEPQLVQAALTPEFCVRDPSTGYDS